MDYLLVIIWTEISIVSQHVINTYKHHSCYGNGCFLFASPFGNALVFYGVIRLFLAFDCG